MPTAKTSVSDPLRIAMVTPDGTQGRIGITLCPGKTDSSAWSGPWARDLDLDLDVIQHWGATALLSLIEDQEFDRFSVRGLGNAVEHRHMEWWHLPIPDGSPPGPVFETAWGDAGGAIRDRLRSGFDVVIHCRGGVWVVPGPSPPDCWSSWACARTRRSVGCAMPAGPVPLKHRHRKPM